MDQSLQNPLYRDCMHLPHNTLILAQTPTTRFDLLQNGEDCNIQTATPITYRQEGMIHPLDSPMSI